MKLLGKSALAVYATVVLALPVNASVFTFGELLLKPVSIKTKIVKEGISGASVTSLKESINNSISSLSYGHSSLSEGLRDIQTRATTQDKARIGRIMATLKMSHKDIEGETFKDVVNDLAYVASVYGADMSKILSCSYCKTDDLASMGYRANLVRVADPNLAKAVKRLPKTPADTTRYLSRMARKTKIKDVSKYLDSSERRNFALFLSFSERSAKKEYRRFFDAVTNFSKASNGDIVLAGPRAKNSFWRIIDGKFSPERADKLATALNEAAKKSVSKREDEFFKQLYKVSDKTPETLSSIEELKSKKCFFK